MFGRLGCAFGPSWGVLGRLGRFVATWGVLLYPGAVFLGLFWRVSPTRSRQGSKAARQQARKPAHEQATKPASQQSNTPARNQAWKRASQEAIKESSQHVSKAASQQASEPARKRPISSCIVLRVSYAVFCCPASARVVLRCSVCPVSSRFARPPAPPVPPARPPHKQVHKQAGKQSRLQPSKQ